MATFINPNQSGLASTNVGAGSVLRECLDAYNERCKACGRDDLELAVPSVGAVSLNLTQTSRLVYGMVYGLEQMVATARWIDDQASAPDTKLTNARWRTNAGLPSGSNTWRRVAQWMSGGQPTFLTPGAIAAGDIYGPWVLQDIQKGIDALRWTFAEKTEAVNRQRKDVEGSGLTEADAITDACSEYAAASWSSLSDLSADWDSITEFGAGLRCRTVSGWTAQIFLRTHKVKITVPTDTLACEADVMVYAREIFYTSFDSGGFGFADSTWQSEQNYASATRTTETTAMLGTPDVCPFSQITYTGGNVGFDTFEVFGRLKWDFSHTL